MQQALGLVHQLIPQRVERPRGLHDDGLQLSVVPLGEPSSSWDPGTVAPVAPTPAGAVAVVRYRASEMPSDRTQAGERPNLERSVEGLLRRGRPLPPRSETVIEDLTDEEGEAFLAAITS